MTQRKDINKKLLILTTIIISLFLLNILFTYNLKYFGSPDERINSNFIANYKKSSNLYYLSNSSSNLGFEHPRSTIEINNKVYPTGFLGLILVYGTLSFLTAQNILSFLLFIISLFYVYKLCLMFFNKNESLILTLLYLIFPTNFYYSFHPYYNNIPALSFLIIGTYYYFKDQKIKNNILSGVFFGCAIFFRNTYALFLLVTIILFSIVSLKEEKIKQILIKNVLIGCMALLSVIQIFILNKEIFNGALNFAETTNTNNNLLNKILWFFLTSGNNPSIFANNLYNYFIKIFWPFSLISIIIAIYFIFKRIKLEKKQKQIIIFFLLYLVYKIYFYYNGTYYGMNANPSIIAASYLRYIPEISFLIIVPFLLFMKKMKLKNSTKIILASIFIINFVIFTFSSTQGLTSYYLENKHYTNINNNVKKVIPTNNTIVYTLYWDKVLFPDYNVATYSSKVDIYKNSSYIVEDMLTNYKANKTIYLMKDNKLYNISKMDYELKRDNLTLERISNLYGGIYILNNLT